MPPTHVQRGSKTPKLQELFEKVTDGTSNTPPWNDDTGSLGSAGSQPLWVEKARPGPNEGFPGPVGGKYRNDLTESDKTYEERVRDYERKLVEWKALKEATEAHGSTDGVGLNFDAASRGGLIKLKDGQPRPSKASGNKGKEIEQYSGILGNEETAVSQRNRVLFDRGPNENHGIPFKRQDKGKSLEIREIQKRVRLRGDMEGRLDVTTPGNSKVEMNDLTAAQRSRASIRDLKLLQDDWENEASKMNKIIGKGLAQLGKHKNTFVQKRIVKKSPFLSAMEQMNLMLADELRKGIPEINSEIEDDHDALESSNLPDEEELCEPEEPQDDGIGQYWVDLCAPLPSDLSLLTKDLENELQGAPTN